MCSLHWISVLLSKVRECVLSNLIFLLGYHFVFCASLKSRWSTDKVEMLQRTPIILGVLGIGGLYTGKRFFIDGPKCTCKTSLAGKTVIITGANTGIGLETAVDLSKRGARIVMACRDEGKGQKAMEEVISRSQNKDVVLSQLDLASLKSVKEFSSRVLREEEHIDILINNAGVAMTPYTKTEDGFELQFGVNHLGHFLLTNLLTLEA